MASPRLMLLGRVVSIRVVDGAVAVGMSAVALFEIASTTGTYSVHSHVLLAVGAASVAGAALWWRRREPFLVTLAGVTVLTGSYALGVTPQSWAFPYVVLLAYSCGAFAGGWESWAGLAAAGAGTQAIAAYAADAAPATAADYVFVVVVIGGAWLAGQAIRRRERQASVERRAAIVTERARIARELHDVIAHSLSVVAIQSDAAEQALSRDPSLAEEPLRAIRRTTQEAMAEMRRLVAMLRVADDAGSHEPQPGLAQLDDLVAAVRATGMPVSVHKVGDPDHLAAGLNLAAYRIVQEALTNARRHAGSSASATVSVEVTPSNVRIEVADNGRGDRTGGQGNGLLGLQERVSLYGGELDAGPLADGGGFRVRARLPLEGSRR